MPPLTPGTFMLQRAQDFFKKFPHSPDSDSFDIAEFDAKVSYVKDAGTPDDLAVALRELSDSVSTFMQRLELGKQRSLAHETVRDEDDKLTRLRQERICEIYQSIDLGQDPKEALAEGCLEVVDLFEHFLATTALGAAASERLGAVSEALEKWIQHLHTEVEVQTVASDSNKVRPMPSLSQESAIDMAHTLKRQREEHNKCAVKVLQKYRRVMAHAVEKIDAGDSDSGRPGAAETMEQIGRQMEGLAAEHRKVTQDGEKLHTSLRMVVGKAAAEGREAVRDLLARLNAVGVVDEDEARVVKMCKAIEKCVLQLQTSSKSGRRDVMCAEALEVVYVTVRQAGDSALAEVMLGSQAGERVRKARTVHVDVIDGFQEATQLYPASLGVVCSLDAGSGPLPEAQEVD